MTRTLALSLVAALAAAPASAELTAEDAWAMFQDVTVATGGRMDGTATRDGDVLTVSNIDVEYLLPFDFGELSMRFGPMMLTETGDGAVAVSYPVEMRASFFGQFGPDDDVTLTGSMLIEQPDQEVTITGTADDMTMVSTGSGLAMSINELDITGIAEVEGGTFDLRVGIGTTEGTTRLLRGPELLTIEGQSAVEDVETAFELTAAAFSSVNTSRVARTTSETRLVLPRDGFPLTEIAAALRAGLSVEGTSDVSGSVSEARTIENGVLVSDQLTVTDRIVSTFRFDADGIDIDGDATGVDLRLVLPEDLVPVPLEASIASARSGFAMPLLQSDTAQGARLLLALDGFDVDDALWRLFDPAEYLPADPLTFVMDLEAEIRPLIDLLDFEAFGAFVDRGETPVEIDSLTIDEVLIAGAGASAAADGRFTFDFDDMESFAGLPRPEGSATARILGLDALLDALTEMGLLSDDDVTPLRFGLAGFTRSVGEDALESVLEITPEAQVFVNGQRIR